MKLKETSFAFASVVAVASEMAARLLAHPAAEVYDVSEAAPARGRGFLD